MSHRMIHHMQGEHVLDPLGVAKNAGAFQEFAAANLPQRVLLIELVDGEELTCKRIVDLKVDVIQVNVNRREIALRRAVEDFQRIHS